MAETQQSKSNQSSRWTLIDLFDFLIWAGIIFAGLALKVLDPVIIGWSILTIGVVGAITKGATLFVKYPILIFIEGLEYLCLAPIFSIGSVYSLDITLTNGFWLATIGAVITGILVIRKYLGKENPLISLLYYIEQKRNTRDLAIGFFGLIISHNLLWIMTFFGRLILDLNYNIIAVFEILMWLAVIAASVVLFAKKKKWIGIGVIAAFLINVLILILRDTNGKFYGLPSLLEGLLNLT